MVEKLRLTFPLLADPDGEGAIKPYEVWDESRRIARPATVIVAPDGHIAHWTVGRDFADRPAELELLEEVRALGLAPTDQPPPAAGDPEPGPEALGTRGLSSYFAGVRSGARALRMRHPDVGDDITLLVDEAERYRDAIRRLLDRSSSG